MVDEMIRKRHISITLLPNPHIDYRGNPLTTMYGEWFASDGTKWTGNPMLANLVGPGMGMTPKAGDVLRVTVEINPQD